MKDPAFLFYSNDFLSGTMLMTDEEIGQVQGEFVSLLKDLTSSDETIMSSLNELVGMIEGNRCE